MSKDWEIIVPEPIKEEYTGIWKTLYELREIARNFSGITKEEMLEEIVWISHSLMSQDDLVNLTVEQAKLFRLI